MKHATTIALLLAVVGLAAPPTVAQINGDYDNSGFVDVDDLALVLGYWGGTVPPVPTGWTGQPQPSGGMVDQFELSQMLANWGASSPTGPVGPGGLTGATFNSTAASEVPGYIVNDLVVDFTGQLYAAQAILALDSGMIYQDGLGSKTAPNGAIIPIAPALAEDTFVTLGGPTFQTSDQPSIAGGAVNLLGGQPASTFDDFGIDITWFAPGGTVISDQTSYMLARFTLSTDAMGSGSILVAAGDDLSGTAIPVRITNGTITAVDPVPEPLTVISVLAGLGVVGGYVKKRWAA